MQFAWQYGKGQMASSYNSIKTVLETNLKLMEIIKNQNEIEKEIISNIIIKELNKMTNKIISNSNYEMN